MDEKKKQEILNDLTTNIAGRSYLVENFYWIRGYIYALRKCSVITVEEKEMFLNELPDIEHVVR